MNATTNVVQKMRGDAMHATTIDRWLSCAHRRQPDLRWLWRVHLEIDDCVSDIPSQSFFLKCRDIQLVDDSVEGHPVVSHIAGVVARGIDLKVMPGVAVQVRGLQGSSEGIQWVPPAPPAGSET